MDKVIVMVRTSTEVQSIEDQKREMEDFCHSEGWKDIVWVERQGASAAKVDDDYRAMIDEVKRRVEEDKYAIVHKHIVSMTAEPMSYGERDKRTHRPNAVKITISTAIGEPFKFLYFPKYYKKHNLYVWNGREWKPDAI